MKRKLLMVVLAFAFVLSIGLMVACADKGDDPVTGGDITLTVENVPKTGMVGREVKLPAASASDSKEGDLTDRVKLNVDLLKADGTTSKQVLFRVAANKEQKFTPSGNELLDYKITYFVSNDAGDTKEVKFDFKAAADTEAPVLSLDKSGDFANFDPATGVTGVRATQDIRLPGAVGKETADDYDVSSRIETRVYLASDAEYASPILNFTGGAKQTFRLIEGNYKVRLTLSDAAGNAAEPIEYPLTVSAPDLSKNLILDAGNVRCGFDSRYNSTLQQLEIGRTSYGSQADDCAAAAVGVSKLHENYVGITLNIDPFQEGGEQIYDIGFVGSKNGTLFYPDGSEGSWAPYLILRISESGTFELRGTTAGSGSESDAIVAFTGTLKDAKDHTLYIKHTFNIDAADPSKSYIRSQIWVDVTPDTEITDAMKGKNYAEYKLARGTSNVKGQLESGLFDRLADEATGAGWLTFGAATFSKNAQGQYYDDIMRIKGVSMYAADETEFAVDIARPVLTSEGSLPQRVTVGETVTLPVFTSTEGVVAYDVYKFDYATRTVGEKLAVNERKVKFEEAGYYYIVVSAKDENGNMGYADQIVICAVEDNEAPVIDVDDTVINVKVGEAFDIPVATVTDNVDKDLTEKVNVGVEGPFYASNISGTKTSILTEGEHWLVYTVSDFAENKAEKRVKVVVKGDGFDATKNLVADNKDYENGELIVAPGALYEYGDKYVYDQKVSVLMSTEYADGSNQLLQINLRGSYADGNKEWPSGIVMRFGATADISLIKHDSLIVASTSNVFNTAYWRGKDVLLQYQVKNIKVGDADYVCFMVWINGKAVQYSVQNKPGVEPILVSENGGAWTQSESGFVAVPVSVFAEGGAAPRGNLSAGPIRIVGYNGWVAHVKELYVGKEYTQYPADPQPPEGIEAPAKVTAAPELNGEQVVNGAPSDKTIAKGPQGESKVYFKLRKTGGEMSLVLTGAASGEWNNGGGLSLHYRNDYNGFYMVTNGGRDDAVSTRDFFFNTGALADDTDYYFAVQMKYVYTDASQTRVKAIDVSMWFGVSEDGLSAVEKTFGGTAVTGEAGYLNVSAMSTAQITSNGILILPSPAGTNTMTVTGIRAELA